MTSFLRDREGNVAVLFGLLLVPIFGFSGIALDYGRATKLQGELQTRADAAALNAAVAGVTQGHHALVAQMAQDIENAYVRPGVLENVSVTGNWVSATDFRVQAEARIATAMAHIIPGVDPGISVAIEAVARVSEQEATYEPPAVEWLDPEAGDYNQIYVYCFDPSGGGSKRSRRSRMTLIADNAGSHFDYDWPRCDEGETLSFRLRNVRHVKDRPHLWNHPSSTQHNYHTDTVLVGGVEQFDIGYDILETVRCDDLESCVGEDEGGVIPRGAHRDPHIESRPCRPGAYMYYGWEDRPPGQPGRAEVWTDPAWTDADYDDIRIVMQCPETAALGERSVRLMK